MKSRSRNIRDREVLLYRRRLQRIIGLYLTLKVQEHKVDCLVLTRVNVLKFFDMHETSKGRMEQIRNDMVPWFQGFHPCYTKGSNTRVEYLFLSRSESEDLPKYFPSLKELKSFIKKRNTRGNEILRTALFTELVNEIPSHAEIARELGLLIMGLRPASH